MGASGSKMSLVDLVIDGRIILKHVLKIR